MPQKKKYLSRIGVYKIESKIHPDKIYIGSSTNIPARWYGHKHNLEKSKHHSYKLQEHYNKYGLSDLVFSVIMYCTIDEIVSLEQYYLNMLNPYFNIFKLVFKGNRISRRLHKLAFYTKPTVEKRWMQGSSFYYSFAC
jgi:group I intron endonuclease